MPWMPPTKNRTDFPDGKMAEEAAVFQPFFKPATESFKEKVLLHPDNGLHYRQAVAVPMKGIRISLINEIFHILFPAPFA